jgi:hypothetical protein
MYYYLLEVEREQNVRSNVDHKEGLKYRRLRQLESICRQPAVFVFNLSLLFFAFHRQLLSAAFPSSFDATFKNFSA